MGSGAPPYVDPSREFVVSAIPGQGQNDPRLWGDAVAWDLGLSGDVYAKVLSSGELVPVSVGEGGSSHVNIYGHRIVWDTWILSDVHVFDMLTRTSSCVGGYESPDIYESLVVWHGHEGDIYGKDLGTGQEYRFSYSSGPWNHLNNPRIWGDTVVWNEWGNSNLWGSRVSTGTVFPVTTCGTVDWPPADLQGDIVVWRDNRNVRGDNNLDIYAADISDPSHVVEFPVCTNPFEQSEPQIYGNIIVWRDHRNADEDIYGYDLVSKTEFPIALGPGDQFSPSVYENMVVWSTETGTATEIHGNYIIPEPGAFSVLVLGRLALVRRRKRR
jgi:beta propeller repeat protein